MIVYHQTKSGSIFLSPFFIFFYFNVKQVNTNKQTVGEGRERKKEMESVADSSFSKSYPALMPILKFLLDLLQHSLY